MIIVTNNLWVYCSNMSYLSWSSCARNNPNDANISGLIHPYSVRAWKASVTWDDLNNFPYGSANERDVTISTKGRKCPQNVDLIIPLRASPCLHIKPRWSPTSTELCYSKNPRGMMINKKAHMFEIRPRNSPKYKGSPNAIYVTWLLFWESKPLYSTLQ